MKKILGCGKSLDMVDHGKMSIRIRDLGRGVAWHGNRELRDQNVTTYPYRIGTGPGRNVEISNIAWECVRERNTRNRGELIYKHRYVCRNNEKNGIIDISELCNYAGIMTNDSAGLESE
jgi:hypothetical protein